MIKISVIIPARNRAHTLPSCLESIIQQDYPASEIIVVDDNSDDNTEQVVQQYSDQGVLYLRLLQSAGAQAARNYGIRMARNEWIAFQDSDDIWLPYKLGRQAQVLLECGLKTNLVVHGNGLKRDAHSCEDIYIALPETSGDCYRDLLLRPAPMFPALLTSKSAIEDAGFLDEACPAYQEWDTSIRLSKQCAFVHIREPLFRWIWHGGHTISKDRRRSVLGYNYVVSRYRNEIIALHGRRNWRRLKLSAVTQAMRAGLWEDAAQFMAEEQFHPSFAVARKLTQLKLAPRGIGRILRLIA